MTLAGKKLRISRETELMPFISPIIQTVLFEIHFILIMMYKFVDFLSRMQVIHVYHTFCHMALSRT